MRKVDSLLLSLEIPGRVRAGEPVPIRLRVTNAGEEPVKLELRGRPVAFEIVVEEAGGSVVWRSLEGRTVSAVLQAVSLMPGESFELEETWDQRTGNGAGIGPGSYIVRGRLPAISPGLLVSPPAELRVLPSEG